MRRAHAGQYGPPGPTQSYDMVEEENEKLVDNLSSKVKDLKSLSIEIGQEIKYHNSFLGEMDSDFDTTGSLLKGTMGKLQALAKKGHHKVLLYLLLFCLFVFFIAWIVVRWM